VWAAWLVHHGLPAWLVPDYFQLTAIAAILASAIALRIASRDKASQVHTRSAVACAYLGAWVGGYLFESACAVPTAVASGSWHAVFHPGRSSYGGLLFAAGGAAVYLWRVREPIAPFFDRASVGAGLGFALVRVGCFIAGCDYGIPTALPWAVRFPSGSLAAVEHARHHFVPTGAPSLPVHPTQLYESGLAVVAAIAAGCCLARGRRDGLAARVLVITYATGRFAIELLRGDPHRGFFLGLSTAQWLSIVIVLAAVAYRPIDRWLHFTRVSVPESGRFPALGPTCTCTTSGSMVQRPDASPSQ
jgi:prolipoprotein diacylglyceryltransferase